MARKILLADDSVTAQNMGRKILADAGYEVITVNNGSAALKKIAELKPDLIVLDVYMPGYSGLEVCQRLKEAGETARIPVGTRPPGPVLSAARGATRSCSSGSLAFMAVKRVAPAASSGFENAPSKTPCISDTRKSFGWITPRSACLHRTSASALMNRASLSETIGWNSKNSSPLSSERRSAPSRAERSWTSKRNPRS